MIEQSTDLNEDHVPTYVPSDKYGHLVQVFCSCGESSIGSRQRTSAEEDHARHAADPRAAAWRDISTTNNLIKLTGITGLVRRSTT